MEIKETDNGNAAASFSKENEECQLNIPAANNIGDDSDSSTTSEKVTQSTKQDVMQSFSGLYAEILIVFAAVSVFSEIVQRDVPLFYIHDYIFLYIFGVGILLLVAVYMKQFSSCFFNFSQNNEGSLQSSSKKSQERKAFTINSYFQIGGFIFGLVAVFVTSLEIFSIFVSPSKCLSSISTSRPVLCCIFILLQICFLKNPKQTVRQFGCLRDFAIMHLFAANGATWIRLLLWESVKDWEDTSHLKHNSSIKWSKHMVNFTVHSLESDIFSNDTLKHYPNHVVHYTSNCWWRLQKPEEEIDVSSVDFCLQHSSIGFFWGQANRFLYPLVAQYYFVIGCILYIVWYNYHIKRKRFIFISYNKSSQCEIRSRSSKGFFLGCIIFATTIIIGVIFFTLQRNLDTPIGVIYFIIFSSSSFASLLGLSQVRKMLTWKSSNDLRFIKLFQKTGLFASIVYGTCSLICERTPNEKINIVYTISAISMIMHACTQYLFIIEVSKKKVDISNIYEKPGRQVVTFLVFCNFSLWMLDCFVNWNNVKYSIELFGDPLWPVVTRWLLPITAFYRFHSFATLIEVWSKTYG